MYSKLAFKEMIMTGDSVIDLPKAVPEDVSSGRKKKVYFSELEVCTIAAAIVNFSLAGVCMATRMVHVDLTQG